MTASAISDKSAGPIRLMALALLAALAFVVVQIVITFTNPESVWTQDKVSSTAQVSTSGGSQNFSFTTDPFNNTVLDALIEDEVQALDVPETSLNLKLTGLVTGLNGSAILRTPDNKESGYRVGDEVISDVVLKSINKGFVVLSVNGQSQRLTFERDETGGLTQPVPNAASYEAFPRSNKGFDKNVGSLFQNINLRRSMKNGQSRVYCQAKPFRGRYSEIRLRKGGCHHSN